MEARHFLRVRLGPLTCVPRRPRRAVMRAKGHAADAPRRFPLGMALAAGGACSSSHEQPQHQRRSRATSRRSCSCSGCRAPTGNVFDYTSFEPGGRLVMLEPPSADGKLTGADVGSDVRRRRHPVVRPLLRRQVGGVLGPARRQRQLPDLLDEPRRDEPQAADQGGNDYVYPIYVPGRADPLHDQPQRRERPRPDSPPRSSSRTSTSARPPPRSGP